eukprot:4864264-Pleurochrysis_carterae.AAC.2
MKQPLLERFSMACKIVATYPDARGVRSKCLKRNRFRNAVACYRAQGTPLRPAHSALSVTRKASEVPLFRLCFRLCREQRPPRSSLKCRWT